MDFSDIEEFIDSLKIPGTDLIPASAFNEFFVVLNAIGDGNCLFHSVSTLVPKYSHIELRKLVCDYYKTFNRQRNYQFGTLKYYLKIQLISDNQENGTLHEHNICRNRVWGGLIDVIVLADVLKTNIIVMINNNGRYHANRIKHSENSPTIIIKYNGVNHFEPVQFRTNDLSLQNYLSKAKPATPEMLREIEKMERKDKERKDIFLKNAKPATPKMLREIEEMERKDKERKDIFLKNAKPATPKMLREIEKMERKDKERKDIFLKNAKPATPKMLREIEEMERKDKYKSPPKTKTNRLIKKLETIKKTLKTTKPVNTNTKKIIKKIETKQNYLKNATTVSPDVLREIQALVMNEAKTVSPETMRLINMIN